MIYHIHESGQQVWISAFNTSPRNIENLFRDLAEKYPDISVQFVDMDKVPGQHYLTLAAVNAIKSFRSKQPIAKTLGMELLVYVSGEKQIGVALKRVGVTHQTRRIAVLAVGESTDQLAGIRTFLVETLGEESNDQLLDDWPKSRVDNVRSGFDIGEKEIKAVIRKKEPVTATLDRLAVERSAMLAGKK